MYHNKDTELAQQLLACRELHPIAASREIDKKIAEVLDSIGYRQTSGIFSRMKREIDECTFS